MHFLGRNVGVLVVISQKFIPGHYTDNNSAVVQAMFFLPKPMITQFSYAYVSPSLNELKYDNWHAHYQMFWHLCQVNN